MLRSGRAFEFVGQVLEQDDPGLARVEVCVTRESAARQDAGSVVYVTKYRGAQVGERSLGVSPGAARELAMLLLRASEA